MQKVPVFLLEKLKKQYGEKITKVIENGYTNKRYVTIRANTLKTTSDKIREFLMLNKITYKNVSWSENALIIDNVTESEIRKLSIYMNGEIYMQSLSSMLPAIVLSPKSGENILDMTAAPGGKTTQLLALSNGEALITACEKNKIRLDRLKYNLQKQGATTVNVMNEDSRKLNDYFSFDKILLDAPCSGSGTININDEQLEKYFTDELIKRSIKTQEELLKKAIKILKTGGELVYSTCSILEEENERNLKKILNQNNIEVVPIKLDRFEGIPMLPSIIEGTICVCPNEFYEGFFVAKLRKK